MVRLKLDFPQNGIVHSHGIFRFHMTQFMSETLRNDVKSKSETSKIRERHTKKIPPEWPG